MTEKKTPFTETVTTPFLKWAGSKIRVLPKLKQAFDEFEIQEVSRLVEPFVGSCAVALNVKADNYLLNDFNKDLADLYNTAITEPDFLTRLNKLFSSHNHEDAYISNRKRFNAEKDVLERALLFVYLNRHCFNGLCRYNASGAFNVPFGKYTNPLLPAEAIGNFKRILGKAKFTNLDFVQVFSKIKDGDIIYCDPPYVPLSATASFANYTGAGFSATQQTLLAHLAEQAIANFNVIVMISNHATEFTRNIYSKATKIYDFEVRRSISSNGGQRDAAPELLAVYDGRK